MSPPKKKKKTTQGWVVDSGRRHAEQQGEPPKRILVITDIGRDMDDTLCFLSLLHYISLGQAELVGVVAAGGTSNQRAAVARGWLRKFGYKDEQVPVMGGRSVGKPGWFSPEGFPTPEHAALSPGDGSDFLLDCARKYKGDLTLLVIAPFSPIADALDKDEHGDLKKIHAIYVQGQAIITEEGKLVPDPQSFNISQDLESATRVFEALEEQVPFRLLGKHTAYAIKLQHEHFNLWQAQLADYNSTQTHKIDLLAVAKHNMDIFRTENPEKFYPLYKVPEDKRNDEDWFGNVGEISVPYDALALLFLMDPGLFDPTQHAHHLIVGGTPGAHGLVDVETTKRTLVEIIRISCQQLIPDVPSSRA
eukprot:CAMPEP_0198204850 /NCGR_PEP_ID=MMETSP1445-20131203/8333_1 /TAXON_ID=36898 /ORGANISM="Pyramimonas sp., Strain CCMP2087" /LENGTH=361 /DNA_ID=CAMNT_0043876927 /DNA_START=311 /DNA_END=1396 /DNA_ORIENTATION=-